MTFPSFITAMHRAAAFVTDEGGITCHAAIVARELGIPAIVGCGNATSLIRKGDVITVSCCEGEAGYVYAGKIPFRLNKIPVTQMPKLPLKLCVNMGK